MFNANNATMIVVKLIVIIINRDSTILDKLAAKSPDLLVTHFKLLMPMENLSLLFKHATQARIFCQELRFFILVSVFLINIY